MKQALCNCVPVIICSLAHLQIDSFLRGAFLDINLTLHGILRDYLPRDARGRATLSLPAGATVADVVAQLSIRQTVSAVVNNVDVEQDHPLHPGDELHMFRMIAGG